MQLSVRSSAYGPTDGCSGQSSEKPSACDGQSAAINSSVDVRDLVEDIGDCDEPRVLGYGRNGAGTTVSMGRARRMSCSVEDGTGIVCYYKVGIINKD